MMEVPVNEPRRLILASESPRRQELLRRQGYSYTVIPARIDESDFPPQLFPAEIAEYLAVAKADAVAQANPHDVILAADTVVAFGDQILGKPADPQHAREMLSLLSGTTHIVITGIAVRCIRQNFERHGHVMSAVRMAQLTERQIDAYVASEEWKGKAGGYGIQDQDPFVTRLNGDFDNIVGLPVSHAADLLAEAGIFPRETEQSAADSSLE